jgi:hypothetical protein
MANYCKKKYGQINFGSSRGFESLNKSPNIAKINKYIGKKQNLQEKVVLNITIRLRNNKSKLVRNFRAVPIYNRKFRHTNLFDSKLRIIQTYRILESEPNI